MDRPDVIEAPRAQRRRLNDDAYQERLDDELYQLVVNGGPDFLRRIRALLQAGADPTKPSPTKNVLFHEIHGSTELGNEDIHHIFNEVFVSMFFDRDLLSPDAYTNVHSHETLDALMKYVSNVQAYNFLKSKGGRVTDEVLWDQINENPRVDADVVKALVTDGADPTRVGFSTRFWPNQPVVPREQENAITATIVRGDQAEDYELEVMLHILKVFLDEDVMPPENLEKVRRGLDTYLEIARALMIPEMVDILESTIIIESTPNMISIDGSRFERVAEQNRRCINNPEMIDPIGLVRIPAYALIRILTRDGSGNIKEQYHCFDVRNLNQWVNVDKKKTNPITRGAFNHRDRRIIRERAEEVERVHGPAQFDEAEADEEDIQLRMVQAQTFEENRMAAASARLQRPRNDTSLIARNTPAQNADIATCANTIDPLTQEDVRDISRAHLVHVLAPLNDNPDVQREVCYGTEGLVNAFDTGDYFNADPAVSASSFPDAEQAFARKVNQDGYDAAHAAHVRAQRLNRFLGRNI